MTPCWFGMQLQSGVGGSQFGTITQGKKMNCPKPVFIVLALVLLTCTGCSRITFGYNHADWLLRYWINDYTSFNSTQKEEIHNAIDDYLRWHRKNALPEYITFLQELEVLANRDSALTPSDVMHIREEISRLYRITVTPSIRPAAHVLSSLDDKQIQELRKNLAKKNHEQRDEMLSGDLKENLAKRANDHIHFVQELAGHLSDEQEDKIREMSMHIPFVTRNYIEHREAMQVDLILLLRSHASEDSIAALLAQWINTPPTPATATVQQTLESYDSAMDEMTVHVYDLLTPEQKDHLRKKISGYIGDLQKLHAQIVPASAAATPLTAPRNPLR